MASIVGPVDDAEIESLRTLVSSGRPLAHLPFLRIGQQVSIEDGPLKGIRGVVLRDERSWRVIVSVEALDRSIAVEVDREVLQAVSSAWPSTSPEIAR